MQTKFLQFDGKNIFEESERIMKNTHLFTGATGFVGSAIILDLLMNTCDNILCVVRAGENQSANERLLQTLANAANGYRMEQTVVEGIRSRCKGISGDILEEHCGIYEKIPENTHFWHCAASLKFEDRHKDAIFETNVTGTKNAISLAKNIGAKSFNYVSTAYVAGKEEGNIAEASVEHSYFNNHYERSKIAGERLVENTSAMPTRILRPSIVIGHSKTYSALNFNGMYGFLRTLVKFKGVMDRTQKGLMDRTRLKILLDPEATLNLVPIDYVARQAVEVFHSGAAGYFHLTNENPPNIGEVIGQMFELVGVRQPEFVNTKENFTWLDKRFSQRLDFYESYLVGKKTFQRERVNALVTPRMRQFELNNKVRDQFYRWYLDQLAIERESLPAFR